MEALADLDNSLKEVGCKLHIFRGCPLAIFRHIHCEYGIDKICFQRDCEPIWEARDNAVKGTVCIWKPIEKECAHDCNPLCRAV